MLPPGDDERFTAYGVMGLPFASGHYLALRHITAISIADPYRAVWVRDPGGRWTFHTTAPAHLSCPRYFGAVNDHSHVRADIDIAWLGETSLLVRVAGVLDWTVDLTSTPVTAAMTAMGRRMPWAAWTSRPTLGAVGRMAGPALGVGRVRLQGVVPNGQRFTAAPVHIWSVSGSSATLGGADLGVPTPLAHQARLGDFWLPQRGIFSGGHGHFETFDPARHRGVDLAAQADGV